MYRVASIITHILMQQRIHIHIHECNDAAVYTYTHTHTTHTYGYGHISYTLMSTHICADVHCKAALNGCAGQPICRCPGLRHQTPGRTWGIGARSQPGCQVDNFATSCGSCPLKAGASHNLQSNARHRRCGLKRHNGHKGGARPAAYSHNCLVTSRKGAQTRRGMKTRQEEKNRRRNKQRQAKHRSRTTPPPGACAKNGRRYGSISVPA